jgi:type VI secretion system secreted protein Hcp
MAFDCFLKIATIPGESTDDKHKDWIEVLSFNHGVSQPTSGAVSTSGGRTSARCDHTAFTIVKSLDKATPKLALSCCNGEHITEITVEMCRAGGDKQKYMSAKMSDVIVSSAGISGDSEDKDSLPQETVAFSYGKIEWVYTELDHKTGKPKGDVKASWDLHANKGA